MKSKIIIIFLIILLAVITLNGRFKSVKPPYSTVEIGYGPLVLWSTYEGAIQSRKMETITSRYSGSTTIVKIVPEGSEVKKGDVLALLDSLGIERELLNLERDYALAQADIEMLKSATLPLERQELEVKILELRTSYDLEQQYLEDTIELSKEDLVSEEEIKRQEQKVKKIEGQLESLELKRKLTDRYLHPSTLKRAQASLVSAEQALSLARQQLADCTIKTNSDGIVVYRPLHIGGEFRTIRVGDTIFENQQFMEVPDMKNLVVHCNVPEAELSKVQPDYEAVITPVAYPDLKLHGKVELVASMAQPISGRPNWQKYFRVLVDINDNDPRLRAGMSTHTSILSYHKEQALLVPRIAVSWKADTPYCRILSRDGKIEQRRITVNGADETHYEVLAGLKPGDTVVLD